MSRGEGGEELCSLLQTDLALGNKIGFLVPSGPIHRGAGVAADVGRFKEACYGGVDNDLFLGLM